MRAPTRDWLARHSHVHGDFDAGDLVARLEAKGDRATVVIPARNETATAGIASLIATHRRLGVGAIAPLTQRPPAATPPGYPGGER